MKLLSKLFLGITLLLILITCDNSDYPSYDYYQYVPVLMLRSVMETTVGYHEAQPIKETGKIYVKGSFIFISEKYHGVHVIDNHNHSAPVKIGFFRVPGCVDMAIKGNILYVDNAVDLVAIAYDSTNWANSKVSSRVRDILPELSPPDSEYIPWEFTKEERPDSTIIVAWKLKD
jgi:hypothetical protein